MGLLDFLGNRTRQKRIRAAANQFWDAVRKGIKFEVPAAQSKDDDALQAIALMMNEHPEVALALHQSRSIICGIFKEAGGGVTAEGWQMLDRGNYFPKAQGGVEGLLFSHERFVRQQGLDPDEMVKQAKTEEAAKHALVVDGHGKLELQVEVPKAVDPNASVIVSKDVT